MKTTFTKLSLLFEIVFSGLRKILFHNYLSPPNAILIMISGQSFGKVLLNYVFCAQFYRL